MSIVIFRTYLITQFISKIVWSLSLNLIFLGSCSLISIQGCVSDFSSPSRIENLYIYPLCGGFFWEQVFVLFCFFYSSMLCFVFWFISARIIRNCFFSLFSYCFICFLFFFVIFFLSNLNVILFFIWGH